jgi:hypothetical protein
MKKIISLGALCVLCGSISALAGTSLYGASDFIGTNLLGVTSASAARTALGINDTTNGNFNTPGITNPVVTGGTFSNPTESGVTNTSLGASLPMWADASQAVSTKTIAGTKTALGIQTGSFGGALVTNSQAVSFGTAYSGVPIVICEMTNATVAVYPSAVTVNGFTATFTGGTNQGGTYTAIGAP